MAYSIFSLVNPSPLTVCHAIIAPLVVSSRNDILAPFAGSEGLQPLHRLIGRSVDVCLQDAAAGGGRDGAGKHRESVGGMRDSADPEWRYKECREDLQQVNPSNALHQGSHQATMDTCHILIFQ